MNQEKLFETVKNLTDKLKEYKQTSTLTFKDAEEKLMLTDVARQIIHIHQWPVSQIVRISHVYQRLDLWLKIPVNVLQLIHGCFLAVLSIVLWLNTEDSGRKQADEVQLFISRCWVRHADDFWLAPVACLAWWEDRVMERVFLDIISIE